MKQAINIRLEKDVVQTLDEYAHELDKTRTSLVEGYTPVSESPPL